MKHDPTLDAYMDVKWKIKSIAADQSLTFRRKHTEINSLLFALGERHSPSTSGLGVNGWIYVFLIRNRQALLLLWLELAMLKGAKRFFPHHSANLLRHWLMPLRGMEPIRKTGKTAFVFMVPDLGNLGDLAIGMAQRHLLERELPEYTVIEIPHRVTYEAARHVARCLGPDDLIFLTGGGNLGTIYPDAEAQRRFLIRKFRESKLILFPQSMFFANTRSGAQLLEQSKRVYRGHEQLTLIARDESSHELMKQHFPFNNILLWPDVVLSLAPIKTDFQREDRITLSIRRDNESCLNEEQISAIQKMAGMMGMDVALRDTNIDNLHHTLADRHGPVKEIWNLYMSSRLVITDRLHGVIFCAITGTPCIALNNNNRKVHNLITTWLSGASFIISLPGAEQVLIARSIEQLLASFPDGAAPHELDPKFQDIRSLIEQKTGNR